MVCRVSTMGFPSTNTLPSSRLATMESSLSSTERCRGATNASEKFTSHSSALTHAHRRKAQLRALIRAGQNFEDEPFIGCHLTNESSDSAA